jgi:hypothetical protein
MIRKRLYKTRGIWTYLQNQQQQPSNPNTLWTPENAANKAFWFDPADTSTVLLNGSNVTQVNDKSSFNRHATQPTASQQPLYEIGGLNSKNILTFDGTNDFLTSSGNYAMRALFVVYRKATPTWTDFIGVVTGRPSGVSDKVAASNTNVGFTGIQSNTNNITSVDTATTAIFTNGTQQNLANFNDFNTGVPTGGATAYHIVSQITANNASGTKNIVIGADAFSTGRWLSGSVAEVLGFSETPSTDIQQRVEGYFAHKWGLIDNLGVSHPYKTNPPIV